MGIAAARAVFVDPDGTLLADVLHDAEAEADGLAFAPHAVEALRLLSDGGYRIVVVSNQPAIALGRFDQAALDRLAQALTQRLRGAGVALDGFYACPHAPGAGCNCRKPAPGLLHEAARVHAIDLSNSWLIGEILDDIEAGRRAGCHTVLLDVGRDTAVELSPLRTPDLRAPDLLAAARVIRAWDDAPGVAQPARPAADGA